MFWVAFLSLPVIKKYNLYCRENPTGNTYAATPLGAPKCLIYRKKVKRERKENLHSVVRNVGQTSPNKIHAQYMATKVREEITRASLPGPPFMERRSKYHHYKTQPDTDPWAGREVPNI